MKSAIPVIGTQEPNRFQLSELSEFVLALAFNSALLNWVDGTKYSTGVIGDLYCPACGGDRRMFVTPINSPIRNQNEAINLRLLADATRNNGDDLERIQAEAAKNCVPSLFSLACVQCSTQFTALIYAGPDGPSLAVLPSCRGGLTTPHTPPGVAFYLDQAQRAQSLDANSAAVAMFRGALEHLLYEQGYKDGMCGRKLSNLRKDIDNDKAPKWAMDMETEFLEILNTLGNGSIHPNDGEVDVQAALDNKLLSLVQQTFLGVLYHVYDVPKQKAKRLGALKAASALLKK